MTKYYVIRLSFVSVLLYNIVGSIGKLKLVMPSRKYMVYLFEPWIVKSFKNS